MLARMAKNKNQNMVLAPLLGNLDCGVHSLHLSAWAWRRGKRTLARPAPCQEEGMAAVRGSEYMKA
jgi:hypothetical protein